MKSNIEALFKSADNLAEKVETTGKVTAFICKSNAMRRSTKEKEGELKSMEEDIKRNLKH